MILKHIIFKYNLSSNACLIGSVPERTELLSPVILIKPLQSRDFPAYYVFNFPQITSNYYCYGCYY